MNKITIRRCPGVPTLALLVLLSARSAAPQYADWFTDLTGDNSGHSVCGFLSVPVSAAGLTWGPVASAGMRDVTGVTQHPAATAFFDRPSFAMTHIEWLMGLRKEWAGGCYPILEWGTVGFSSQLFTAGKFNDSRDINEDPSAPRYLEYALGASFAREILYRTLAVGASLSYVESRLDDATGRTAAAAGDAALDLPWMRACLSIANVGPRITYTATPEPLPTEIGGSASFMPLVKYAKRDRFDLEVGAGVRKTLDQPLVAGVNGDAALLRALHLRAGYEYAAGGDLSAVGVSLGAGLQLDKYGADFGWKNQSRDIGAVWGISAAMRLDEVRPPTAAQLLKTAEDHFAKRRYALALKFAQRALDLDPNLWKAHVLIARVNELLRREEGLEIALIYSGNIKGQFVPVIRDKETIGGLGRQAAVVKELRTQFPGSILVNTGNTVEGSADPRRVQLAAWYFGHVPHDAYALGKSEIGFVTQGSKPQIQYLCTNGGPGLNETPATSKIVKAAKYKVMIVAALAQSAGPPGTLDPPIDDLKAKLTGPDAAACNLRVLVLNDAWNSVDAYAQALPQADIIVCGGIHQAFSAPMKSGNALVVSPGDSGMYVGNLMLRLDRDGKLLSAQNNLIALDDRVVPEPLTEQRAREVSMRAELESAGIDSAHLAQGTVDGALVFVSSRYGASDIFLKVIEKTAEFPLTFGISQCFQPGLSLQTGVVVYRERTDDDAVTTLASVRLNGTERRTLCKDLHVSDACLSPDGRWVYFAAGDRRGRYNKIFRMNPQGATRFPVISWEKSCQKDLAVSPDGGNLVFCSNRDVWWQVFLASSTGEKPIRISELPARNAQPRFSPDGRRIAYLSDLTNGNGKMDLWVYDAKAGTTTQATRQARVQSYCWLDDNETIVYSAGINIPDLNTINVASHANAKLLVKDSVKEYSECLPRLMTYAKKTRIVYVREPKDGARHVFWANPDGTDDRCIVNSRGSDWVE